MTRLVYQMIRPTLIDQRGQLILLGTCENIPLTFFEQVTEGREAGWSVHKWTALDNPYMKEQWEEEIADLVKNNPNVIYTSWFKTHYLNQWCSDDDLLIFPYKNEYGIAELPVRKGYEYVLGIDLGYNDASAFSLMAYHKYDNKAYVIESYKKEGLTLTKVTDIIKIYQNKYPISDMVIDGANKQGVEDIKDRFQIKLESAQKTEKAFFLKAMNDDLIEGNLRLVEKENAGLIGEWKQLQWKDEFKENEDPRCQNHLCFTKGTLISTSKGLIPIEKIKLGDLIITREGPRRATCLMVSLFSGNLINLRFSNGSSIKCTDNHPIYTDIGLVRADALTYARRFVSIVEWENIKNQKALFLMAKTTIDIQNLAIRIWPAILGAVLLVSVVIFIVMFGNIIMGKYQKVILSIISIVILVIIPLIILSLLKHLDTYKCTCEQKNDSENQEKQSRLQLNMLQNGIDQKQEKGGTKNTAKTLSEQVQNSGKRLLKELVKYAKAISLLIYYQKKREYAQINATPKREEIAESTTKKESVSGVEKFTQLTNMPSLDFAVSLVSLDMETVSGKKVYNLTVEKNHEYFANGILVSNSDATLYAWRKCCHFLAENEPKKIKKGTPEHQEYLEEQEIIRLEREFKEQQEEREFYVEESF